MNGILLRDLQDAWRGLKRNPIFSMVVCVVLALGIGANTALFSVVNKVLLQPLPFDDPERLVEIQETQNGMDMNPAYLNYQDWCRMSYSFESLAFASVFPQTLPSEAGAERIPVAFVSGNFFRTYRVQASVGRMFAEAEDRPGAPPVAVLAHGSWKTRFGGDPGILGRTIALEDRDFTIIGVLPHFPYHQQAEVYVPVAPNAANFNMTMREEHRSASVTGRLKRGVTLEQARAELKQVAAQLEQQYPGSNKGISVAVVSLHERVSGWARHTILTLFGAVAFLLLIACVNVANLMLARAVSREKEIAIRVALGVSRGQIMRQLLLESSVLGLLGGLLGLLIAPICVDALMWLVPESLSAGLTALDWRVLGFTLAVSICTALLFGLVPALQLMSVDTLEAMKEGGRTSMQGGGRDRLRSALVISQVALALVLLMGTGLLVRSLYRLMSEDTGFRTSGVLTLQVTLQGIKQQISQKATLRFEEILNQVRRLPGVQAAEAISFLPMAGQYASADIQPEGDVAPASGAMPTADHHSATPGYFAAMGIPLLKGRHYSVSDGVVPEVDNQHLLEWFRSTHFVCVVSQEMARRYWPGQDPVGRRFRFGPPSLQGPWVTVLGVVGNSRQHGLDQAPRPEFYLSPWQRPYSEESIVVRTSGDPAALVSTVRKAILSVDRNVILSRAKTMEQIVRDTTSSQRANLRLMGGFAGLALLLAAVGIYGLIAYSVAQRQHEFGIRMALGASPSGLLRLVLGQGARLAGAGVAIGVLVSLVLSRVMVSLLYGIQATDPLTYTVVALVMLATALFAASLPARRATKVDPMIAMRSE